MTDRKPGIYQPRTPALLHLTVACAVSAVFWITTVVFYVVAGGPV